MKIELDVHTHTIASGHAFSTLQEMAQAAADKGLKVLGITEHSPGVPGTCHPIYFRNLHVVPRRMYGVELLLGAEINILDGKGNLDLDEDYMKMLDIRIAGIHSHFSSFLHLFLRFLSFHHTTGFRLFQVETTNRPLLVPFLSSVSDMSLPRKRSVHFPHLLPLHELMLW